MSIELVLRIVGIVVTSISTIVRVIDIRQRAKDNGIKKSNRCHTKVRLLI